MEEQNLAMARRLHHQCHGGRESRACLFLPWSGAHFHFNYKTGRSGRNPGKQVAQISQSGKNFFPEGLT